VRIHNNSNIFFFNRIAAAGVLCADSAGEATWVQKIRVFIGIIAAVFSKAASKIG
jgi:hypothetical protein